MSVEKEGSIQIDDAVAIHDLNELGYEQVLVRVSDPLISISTRCMLTDTTADARAASYPLQYV